MMKLKFVIGFLASISLMGCGKLSNQISATFKTPSILDFKKSEIINNGPGISDGQSELLVVIQLTNSDGSSVKSFKPAYEVVSGLGVSTAPCTTSNANGVSTCVLKSSLPGTKQISITNINIELKANIVFNAPAASKELFGLTSAEKTQTQGNFKISATIGSQEPGVLKTSGVFKLYGGVQGEQFSR
jgi:hypothetical protein